MFFIKMHGLGNDFILIDDTDDKIDDYSRLAAELCDRHFGIGADGILVVRKSDIADSRMLIYNSDGSQAEMCGNGIRCFAKYLYESGTATGNTVNVETLAGLMRIELIIADGTVNGVRVNMGSPDFNPGSIPAIQDKDAIINEPIEIDGQHINITSMLMGVPHTIIFVDEIDLESVESLGRKIERSRYFPKGTNVNFVKVVDRDNFIIRTWERGAGLTLACGTGTCAALAACAVNKKTGRKAYAHLPGGRMIVEWESDGNIYMTGPAATVFKGEYKR